jgi:hypothetical protein
VGGRRTAASGTYGRNAPRHGASRTCAGDEVPAAERPQGTRRRHSRSIPTGHSSCRECQPCLPRGPTRSGASCRDSQSSVSPVPTLRCSGARAAARSRIARQRRGGQTMASPRRCAHLSARGRPTRAHRAVGCHGRSRPGRLPAHRRRAAARSLGTQVGARPACRHARSPCARHDGTRRAKRTSPGWGMSAQPGTAMIRSQATFASLDGKDCGGWALFEYSWPTTTG